MKIPPEIDNLIWSIAENPDPDAVIEFSNRYPAYRSSLMKRISTVRNLRGMASAGVPAAPGFVYPGPYRFAWPRKAVAAIGLGALALASFATTFHILAGSDQGPVAAVSNMPIQPPQVEIRTPRSVTASPYTIPPEHPNYAVPSKPAEFPQPKPQDSDSQATAFSEAPIGFHIEAAQLSTVLSMLARSIHRQIVFGPGMPNPKIRVDYDDMAAQNILDDLAKKYAFVLVDEGAGEMIAVPEVNQKTGTGGYYPDDNMR